MAIGLTLLLLQPACSATASPPQWPQWEAFKVKFVQKDGRIIEHSQQSRTTSEAQSYVLFHALVADDRATFQRILDWTENNLAGGHLEQQLPAWLWGKDSTGQWTVLDRNPASDADMWLSYVLLEAGRHWHVKRYTRLGKALLTQIETREITRLPGLGPMVLPGPQGFSLANDTWRLNLSYLPLQLIHKFIRTGNSQLWSGVMKSTLTLLEQATEDGIVPDWVLYDPDHGIRPDKQSLPRKIGYDAIRVYLWAGMLPGNHPLKSLLSPTFTADCTSKLVKASNPAGFDMAVTPLMKTTGNHACLARLIKRADQAWDKGLLGEPVLYYNQILSMFALAWLEKRYQFTQDGDLLIRQRHEYH
jgi:endoglucanase